MSRFDSIRTIASRASDEHITFYASSIAYYAFFSVIPLLLLTLAIGSFVGQEAFAERIIAAVEEHLSASGREIVSQTLENQSGQVGASIVGVLGLAWSAVKVVRAIDMAFDEVYAADVETPFTRQILDGIVVLGLVGVGVSLMVGIGTFISRPTIVDLPYVDIVGWTVLVVGLTIVFLPMYYVMPPQQMSLAAALPGTLVVSVGWLFLQAGFQLYSSYAAGFEAYGVIGGVLLFLTWLYFASTLLLLGAVVNAVLEQDLERTSPV
ncbi:YihY/virulence factor BrkB family protein [Natronococcus sp. A-GB7]|uniref:YihY/virulence factor BrkB family protein n=1 Tax=Natronococcus sp. A-GB7 TaxID=3037649 RepID=UPI00241E7C2B|nr:YihY/virulence factor BrkB family protein [Natronococcus sp. A-GB7]MDG5819790.1 YihY/virulence factor BrkB family protein [Natronococcus sp. A-GB7]